MVMVVLLLEENGVVGVSAREDVTQAAAVVPANTPMATVCGGD